MRYVTSIERLAIEEGMQKGIQQGMQQGMQQGLVEGKAQVLTRQLTVRFGELPAWVQERVAQADESMLDSWTEAVFSADSLGAVFGVT